MKKDILRLIKAFGLDVFLETENKIMIDFTTIITIENNQINFEVDGNVTNNISYTELFEKLKELYY